LDWGKWDRIDRHCATITSGIEAFSLKILAFLASQIPQLIKSGRDFISLFLGSHVQFFQASSKESPFHMQFCLRLLDVYVHTFMVKGHVMRIWKVDSFAFLQRAHLPGPSI
jgi:hypothetical protein